MATTLDSRLVLCLFDTLQQADVAKRELIANGIAPDRIRLIAGRNATEPSPAEAALALNAMRYSIGTLGSAAWGGGLLTGAAVDTPSTRARDLIQAFERSGIAQDHAHFYVEGLRHGGTVLVLHIQPTEVSCACTVLDRTNCVDIQQRASHYRDHGWIGSRALDESF